jgi:predicted RNA-binding Zn-ribbon protein involved in translation (DUF1610 family)
MGEFLLGIGLFGAFIFLDFFIAISVIIIISLAEKENYYECEECGVIKHKFFFRYQKPYVCKKCASNIYSKTKKDFIRHQEAYNVACKILNEDPLSSLTIEKSNLQKQLVK